jgi:hypothetical protein
LTAVEELSLPDREIVSVLDQTMHPVPQQTSLNEQGATHFVELTHLADLKTGKRGEGDSVWLEAHNRG